MQRGNALSPRVGDRRGLNGVRDRVRRKLMALSGATQMKLEAAEETGKRVEFPDRGALIEYGGTIGEVVSGLLPEDIDRVPDEYLPYLLDPEFRSTRLRAGEIREIFEGRREPVPQTPAPAQKNAGGRPPQEFWDDLLIEITRQIHYGEWKPSSVDEIVSRMDEWLIAHGYEKVAESTLKKRARKIRDAFLGD